MFVEPDHVPPDIANHLLALVHLPATFHFEGRTLFLGTHFGLFRSEDGGRSWRSVLLSMKRPHLDVLAIAPDSRHPLTIYIATHEAGVLKSADDGRTWNQAKSGLGGLDVHGLAVDPDDSRKLYAAVEGSGKGIYRSTDKGGKWTRVGDGPAARVNVLAAVATRTGTGTTYLYAGTAEGLQRSADSSRGWERVGGGPANQMVYDFAVDPTDPELRYVAVPNGLFKSTDAGKSWKPTAQGLEELRAVAVNPKRSQEVYTISSGGVIFMSPDGAMTWDRVDQVKQRTCERLLRYAVR
jgi:photosystem II stability/assembly factor-like uncharacterized protein